MIVLLGNQGQRYARTRHNVAWLLEGTQLLHDADPWQRKFNAEWTRARIGVHTVVVLKPQMMMNLSGESVQAAARFFRYQAADIAVAHDEVELPFATLGFRLGGGLAGHNGLRSVAHCLGTPEFRRIRIGIGRPPRGEIHGHVLGRFTPEEEALLPRILDSCARLVEQGYREGADSLPQKVVVSD